MTIADRVQKDMVQAMKEKDAVRTGVLRMIKSALKNKEIEKRAQLSDTEELQVLQSLVKQRAESIRLFEAGGRTDLVTKEKREKKIIETYLPESLSSEEIDRIVNQVIEDRQRQGPVGTKDMGEIMKQTMARLRETGKMVDGKSVNERVRIRLQKPGNE